MDINEPNQKSFNFDFLNEENVADIPTARIALAADSQTHVAPMQNAILTQNIQNIDESEMDASERKLTHIAERKIKLRWILAISCLPLFGIYAAFGLVPQTLTSNITSTTVVEELTLPENNEALANIAEQRFWYKEHVRRDDTLSSVLSRLNIRNRNAARFIRSDAIAHEMISALTPGHALESQTDSEGTMISLEYQLDADQFITIKQAGAGYVASKSARKLQSRSILKSAKIRSTIFNAADDANIPESIAAKIAEIFEGEIDFNTDLRRGDRFSVIYEARYDGEEQLGTGEIQAVEFINHGKIYRAIGFKNAMNEMQYYTPEGKNLHKSFLRSPLEFTRISSGFSQERFHPILQRMKAHKGTDFAAPTGTGVKASGDAVVDFVGVKGGYGNVVVLKHDNGVSTVYGHLSRFAGGLHQGQKVAQGDTIGFVGMTGLATGPHLHYEFLLDGVQRNPMTVALPKADPITGQNKAVFDAQSAQLTAQLKLLSTSNVALLD